VGIPPETNGTKHQLTHERLASQRLKLTGLSPWSAMTAGSVKPLARLVNDALTSDALTSSVTMLTGSFQLRIHNA
jgi:hypothetical protein